MIRDKWWDLTFYSASLKLQLDAQAEVAEEYAYRLDELNKKLGLNQEEQSDNRIIRKSAKGLDKSLRRRLDDVDSRSGSISSSNQFSGISQYFNEKENLSELSSKFRSSNHTSELSHRPRPKERQQTWTSRHDADFGKLAKGLDSNSGSDIEHDHAPHTNPRDVHAHTEIIRYDKYARRTRSPLPGSRDSWPSAPALATKYGFDAGNEESVEDLKDVAQSDVLFPDQPIIPERPVNTAQVGPRIIDNGRTIRVEHGQWSNKVQQEDDRDIGSGEEMMENSQMESSTRSMEVRPPGSIMDMKGPSQSQSGGQRLTKAGNQESSLVPDSFVCTSDSMRHNTKGQRDLNSGRNLINGERATRTTEKNSNRSRRPGNGDSTVERRNASRESDSRRKPPSWSRPDIASLAPRENSHREKSRKREVGHDRGDDVGKTMENISHREESERRVGPSSLLHTPRRGSSLQETRELVDDGGAVQIPHTRVEISPKTFERRDTSKKPKGGDSTSERPRRNGSKGCGSRRDASSWSEGCRPVDESEAEPPGKDRSSSKDQHSREVRNKVGEERRNTKPPKLTPAKALENAKSAKADYERRKNLKPVAEKRKRDGRGVVIGDPVEDDEFERKKSLGRGKWSRRVVEVSL